MALSPWKKDAKYWKLYYDDNLVRRFRHTVTGEFRFHGKRAPAGCQLTTVERRAYVEGGATAAVKAIRNGRSLCLDECKLLLDRTRGVNRVGRYTE